jgi:ribose transport system permease protein
MKRSALTQFAGPVAALVLIAVVVAATTPSFMAAENFRNIVLQAAVLSIVAIGSTVVIITGGIDLSPGSMIACLTMVLAIMVKSAGISLWLVIPAVVLLGGMFGVVNGLLVAYARVPAFIVTLAGLSAFKGMALSVGGGTPVFSLSADLGQVFYGQLFGIPFPLYYMACLYALATVLLNHTKLGREIYAVGGNESASRLSGINVARVRLISFVIAGACAGVGGVLLSARLNSGSPNYGALIELQAIAAAVVGGASLAGGRGHVINTLVGALIIVVVQNGLNLNAISTSAQSITIGLIILLAVCIDIWRDRFIGRFSARFAGKRPLFSR